jgi:hypothetical protein
LAVMHMLAARCWWCQGGGPRMRSSRCATVGALPWCTCTPPWGVACTALSSPGRRAQSGGCSPGAGSASLHAMHTCVHKLVLHAHHDVLTGGYCVPSAQGAASDCSACHDAAVPSTWMLLQHGCTRVSYRRWPAMDNCSSQQCWACPTLGAHPICHRRQRSDESWARASAQHRCKGKAVMTVWYAALQHAQYSQHM